MKRGARQVRLAWLVVSLVFAPFWLGCSGGGDGDGEEIIVDNRDPGCVIVDGAWDAAGTGDGNGSWGEDFYYLYADQTSVGHVRFYPGLTATARYGVSIYWSASENRTTAQPVLVHDAYGNDTTYSVNLQQYGHQWFALGSHDLGVGSYVEFSNDTAAGYCNADAVRFVR